MWRTEITYLSDLLRKCNIISRIACRDRYQRAHGVSAIAIARATDLSRQTIYRIERDPAAAEGGAGDVEGVIAESSSDQRSSFWRWGLWTVPAEPEIIFRLALCVDRARLGFCSTTAKIPCLASRSGLARRRRFVASIRGPELHTILVVGIGDTDDPSLVVEPGSPTVSIGRSHRSGARLRRRCHAGRWRTAQAEQKLLRLLIRTSHQRSGFPSAHVDAQACSPFGENNTSIQALLQLCGWQTSKPW